MPRGITCIPKHLKDKLIEDIENEVPHINDEAVDESEEGSPKTPARVTSTLKLAEYIRSLPECA